MLLTASSQPNEDRLLSASRGREMVALPKITPGSGSQPPERRWCGGVVKQPRTSWGGRDEQSWALKTESVVWESSTGAMVAFCSVL